MVEVTEARSHARPPVLAFVDVSDPGRSAEVVLALEACGYPALVRASDAPGGDPRNRLLRVLDEARAKQVEFVLRLDGRALPGTDSVARLVEALLGDESLAGVGPSESGRRPRHVESLVGFGLYRVGVVAAGRSGLVCATGRLASLPWVEATWMSGEAP